MDVKTQVFASLLFEEIHARKFRESGLYEIQDYLNPTWEEIRQQGIKLRDNVRESGGYFTDDDSMFAEYKRLREKALPEKAGMRRIVEEFTENMTKEELEKKALDIVGVWQVGVGIEKK